MYKTEDRYWTVDNGIIYDSEIDIFSMQELFKNVVYAHNPDRLYYFNANHLGSGSLITDKYGQTYQTLIYAPHGEVLLNKFYGDYDEPYKFGGHEKDNESGLDYAKARYQDPNIGFNSTDAKWFDYPDIHSYNYCHNNPIMNTDETGMGDDIYVYKDKAGEDATKTVNTGDKTPNRLFVQDQNATADTKNRKEYDGMYFEQKMIPKEAYSAEDFENNHPLSFFGVGDSQFDKDRTDYVSNAGKYSDKNFLERNVESIKDEGVGNKVLELVSVVLTEGKSARGNNGFSHTRKSQSTGKLKGTKGDRHDAQYTRGGKNRPENPNIRKGARERREKGKIIN